ncbi:SMC family ATPase [Kitasatospora aureofaciens]|uniref:AAA family ATPase n=1 Tax=Kitasatospora aureofaciens TaxID=1894 RepID=UPI001C495A12|nr:SMC family ATPase [Kitasatospora aureofaciens]MBV6701925.1 SMC family ATPase [Kitasatospora aureofaciens]
MKPLTLDLTGFRSYPSRTTIDFTGKSLVAALGDTGAGKSSLLDAITYALFRKSTWAAKESRQLIADGAKAMSVDLTFLHDGQHWHVHRTMHATNPNAGRHHLTNLDTGEETDGATAVDTRIQTTLQMGYDTFLRVGLLPQGKFDQLLTAAPKERSERLRELFGADSLESVHRMADRHTRTLQTLLGDAKAKRAGMPDSPAQDAHQAASAAAVAAARADRLGTAIDGITALRNETAEARRVAASAAAAAQSLSTRTVADVNTVLDALEPVAADIAARHDTLNRRVARAEALEAELTTAITAADTQGEGRDALTKAAMLLETLAADAEEHRGERDRLATLTDQIADEHTAIATAETDLAERTKHGEPLAEAARAAAVTSRQIRTSATTARTRVAEALSVARRVTDTASAHTTAVAKRESAREALGPLEEETATANSDLMAAQTVLEALQLRDKAAAIAAELSPEGDCPVCHRQLPIDFEPEAAADTAELAAAREQLSQARTTRDATANRLAKARAAAAAAEETVRERERDHQIAQQKAQDATAEAVHAFVQFAALAAETGTGFDTESASATLATATALLANRTATGATQPDRSEREATPVTDMISACEKAADNHAEELQAEVHRHTAKIEADGKTLAARKNAHQRHTDDTTKATERHTRAVAKTAAEVRALPLRIQTMLAHEAIDVAADQVAAAATTVAARQAEVQELFDQREAERTKKAGALADQRALDQETRTRLERPLTELRGNLDAWAQAATDALTHLEAADRHQVPRISADPTIAEVRQYAAELSTTTSTLSDKLTERANTATDRVAAAQSSLDQHAHALADIEGFNPAADLTAPQALHPLVAAAAQATKEAEHQRQKSQEAQNLIKPAADLDFAITAGTARYEASEVLRRELVDAKFLGHLTALRTHALLGVASDLLGQMSDNRFGFADNLDIISRSSGVVHHPNRLSGGEKFLASLALALALAELHSHSGPTLGSLFLDEGFAALDTAALDAALEVLRTQVGSDRLVMVISHLHAVAEAVDDVLWVERSPAGSSARWLTPAERDELVQTDLASGLQTLTQ